MATDSYIYDDDNDNWTALEYKKNNYAIIKCFAIDDLDDEFATITVMDEDDFIVIQSLNVQLYNFDGMVGFIESKKSIFLHEYIAKSKTVIHVNGITSDNRKSNLSHSMTKKLPNVTLKKQLFDEYNKLVKASDIQNFEQFISTDDPTLCTTTLQDDETHSTRKTKLDHLEKPKSVKVTKMDMDEMFGFV